MHNNANNSEMLSRSYRAALKKNLVYFLFALPAVIYVISLSFYPAINVVYDSFIVKDKFSLANYTGLPGENLYPALIDTLIVSVGALLIQLMFALAVAMIMIKPFKGNRIFSTIVIIPFGISTVVSAWVFSEIFSAIGGYANSFLILFGQTVNWHATTTSELGIVMFSDFWKNTPLIALILFGGLSSISPSMYEAAAVDGAGPFKRFLHITLPAIGATITAYVNSSHEVIHARRKATRIAILFSGNRSLEKAVLKLAPSTLAWFSRSLGKDLNPPSITKTVSGSTTSSCAKATEKTT